MKRKLIISLMFVINVSYAKQFTFQIIDKVKKNKSAIIKRELKKFVSDTSFNGKNFKIVEGRSEEAISFNSTNELLLLQAATVYYHLEKARDFYVNHLKSNFVKNKPQVTIRLNLKNNFNDLGKFANIKNKPQFNNAVTIPSGEGYIPANVKPWESEIWFRPSKLINVSEISGHKNQNLEIKSLLSRFRSSTNMMTFRKFLTKLILGDYTNAGANLISSLFRTATPSFITEFAYQTTGTIAGVFSRKWYRLDAALVPEIIYHEYSHLALSDIISINVSTPLNEGLADYFAGQISKSETLGLNSKYNLFSGKEVDRKSMYNRMLETTDYANSDFVFGLLTQVDETLGGNQSQFIYQMRNTMNASGTIRDDLTSSILSTCLHFCKNPRVDIHKLRFLLLSKGL